VSKPKPEWLFHASVISQQQLSQPEWALILQWLADPKRKPAHLAFTAGSTRQVAYSLEGPLGALALAAPPQPADSPTAAEPGL